VNPRLPDGDVRARENGPAGRRARMSVLGFQVRPAVFLVEAAMRAAGRSLPDMGPGFRADGSSQRFHRLLGTLSHGLSLPH